MTNISQIKNGGNPPVGAPLYPPTLVSSEPYYSVNQFNENNCLSLIKEEKTGQKSILNKNNSKNCLRTLRIMNILTLTYADYIKYLTIVKSYYENPLYFKVENNKYFFYTSQEPGTKIYTIQFIGTTFLNDNIDNMIKTNKLDSLLNHIQPHYYLYLINSSTNIPLPLKKQVYNRMTDIFVIKTFSDVQKILTEYYSIPNPFVPANSISTQYRQTPKVTNFDNIPDSNYMWNWKITQQITLDIDYLNSFHEFEIKNNDYKTVNYEQLLQRTNSESFSRGSNPIYIIDKDNKQNYSSINASPDEKTKILNEFKNKLSSYGKDEAIQILIAMKIAMNIAMHELMTIGSGIKNQTGPFTKLFQDNLLETSDTSDDAGSSELMDSAFLFMAVQDVTNEINEKNKEAIINIILNKMPCYFDIYPQIDNIDKNIYNSLRVYNSQSHTLTGICFTRDSVQASNNIQVGVTMQITKITNVGTTKSMSMKITSYHFWNNIDTQTEDDVQALCPKIYNGFYKHLWEDMKDHSTMKASAPIDVTIKGGWVPKIFKPTLDTLGIRNISNIEEIKHCDISPTATPRLFSILNPLKIYMPEMYDYYYPLDTDSEEIKQQKCDTLNELRRQWIQYKQTNSEVISKMPRAILARKLGIPSDSTRYFEFLRENFCSLEAEESRIPLGCNIRFGEYY